MAEYFTYKRVYYLSFQDGRVDDIDYDTHEQAEAERQKYKIDKNSICVMSNLKQVAMHGTL